MPVINMNTLLPLHNNRAALYLYRASNLLGALKIPVMPHILYILNAIIFGCEIHYKAKIGKKFQIAHSPGIIIGAESRIGDNVKVYSGVVVGRSGPKSGMPTIGDRVTLGTGCKLLGSVRIESDCRIGPNAVVMANVAAHKTILPCSYVKLDVK